MKYDMIHLHKEFELYLQTVQDESTSVPHWSEHVEYSTPCDFTRLSKRFWTAHRQTSPSKEHRCCVPPWVCRDDFLDFYGVVCEKVMQDHLTGVAKHVVCVVPVTVEAEHMTIVVQELLECVHLLIGTKRLLRLVHLQINDKENRIIDLSQFINNGQSQRQLHITWPPISKDNQGYITRVWLKRPQKIELKKKSDKFWKII